MVKAKWTSKRKTGLLGGLCIIVALVLLLGCGPSQKPTSPGSTQVKYTEYKIGMTAARSGDQAYIGDFQVAGAEVAVEEINANGGIDGIPIKLIIEDNGAKPTMAVTAFNKLINIDKVPICLTSYSSPQLAQIPIADEKEVVMVNVGASSPELLNCGKYIFHIQPLGSEYLRVSTNYACMELGLANKRWASVYVNDAMGRGFSTYVVTTLPKYGVTEILQDNWESSAMTDFRSIVAKVINFRPDAVFDGGFVNDGASFLKQLREAGFDGLVMCAWGGADYLTTAGNAALGSIYGEQTIPENERMATIKEKILQKPMKLKTFHTQSINSYDAVYFIAESIKYAKDNFSGDYFTGPMLYKAMVEKHSFNTLSTPGILSPDQCLSRPLAVKGYDIVNGTLTAGIVLREYTSEEVAAMPSGQAK